MTRAGYCGLLALAAVIVAATLLALDFQLDWQPL